MGLRIEGTAMRQYKMNRQAASLVMNSDKQATCLMLNNNKRQATCLMLNNNKRQATCLMLNNNKRQATCLLLNNNKRQATCLLLNKKGITLIELVIAIGLLSIVFAIGYSFYLTSVRGFLRESTSVDNQFNVRYASDTIGRQIRRADTVTVDVGNLKLTYPNGSTLKYCLEGDVIKGGSYKVVEGINSFVVSKIGDTIYITIQSKENSDGEAYELSFEITIRK